MFVILQKNATCLSEKPSHGVLTQRAFSCSTSQQQQVIVNEQEKRTQLTVTSASTLFFSNSQDSAPKIPKLTLKFLS